MYGISRDSLKIVATAGCLSLLAGQAAFGQVLEGDAAIGSWRADKPGVRRLLRPQDLPAPSKPDGSLFVTEDGNGTIWRVSYRR